MKLSEKNEVPLQDKHFTDDEILKEEEEFINCYGKHKNRTIKILLGLYKPHLRDILISSVFFGLKSFPAVIMPVIIANIIDIATNPTGNWKTKFAVNIIAIIVFVLLNIPTHMIHTKHMSIANRNVEAGLRGAMIRKLQHLSIPFHKEMESGRIQSKVMRDVEAVENLSSNVFITLLDVIINMTLTVAVVVSKSFTVFCMFLLCVPAVAFTMRPFRKKMRERNHAFRKEIEATSSDVMDMVELVPITRAHALENMEVKKFTGRVTNVAKIGYRLDLIQNLFGATSWVIFTLFQIMCLTFTGFLACKGKITVGEIALYQTYFTSLTGKVQSILNLTPMMAKGAESLNSIGEILNAYDVEDFKGKHKLNKLDGHFEFKDVVFDYDERTPVLKGLNLTVNSGETVAFVGESGAGKTTILNLLIGFNIPTSGKIFIDGIDMNDINLHSYRQNLAVVPQNTILFSGTVKDNITYGRPKISDKKLNEIIDASMLRSVINGLPDGINTSIGEHGGKLSGGQRQRIAIARALIRDPSVIIFDEATSALDSATEREIQKAIDNLSANRTTFIVAHRLSTIKNADKIAVMKDGRCVEFGSYDELMDKKGEFFNLKKLQS